MCDNLKTAEKLEGTREPLRDGDKITITWQLDGLAEKANTSQNSSAMSEPVSGVS